MPATVAAAGGRRHRGVGYDDTDRRAHPRRRACAPRAPCPQRKVVIVTKSDRRLDWLPDYSAEPNEWRDWLTAALGMPTGFRVESFTRFGRQSIDACELVVIAPSGDRLRFRFAE